MASRVQGLAGRIFGRLTVIDISHVNANGHAIWRCRCECSGECLVRGDQLRGGQTSSCGCIRGGIASRISRADGVTAARKKVETEYRIWRAMLNRCLNPLANCYENYGGRGITVCDEWLTYESFVRDMGPRPSTGHSVERMDNDRGYNKENCRWATAAEQAINRRTNVWIDTVEGPVLLKDLASRTGINQSTLRRRLLRGMELSQALKPTREK